MTEHYLCPRCEADLPFGVLSDECPKCKLSFQHSTYIRPVRHGTHVKEDEIPKPNLAGAIGQAFWSAFKRLLVSALTVVVVVALLVIVGMPFGGGGESLIILLWVIMVIGPLWVLKPLLTLFSNRFKIRSKTK